MAPKHQKPTDSQRSQSSAPSAPAGGSAMGKFSLSGSKSSRGGLQKPKGSTTPTASSSTAPPAGDGIDVDNLAKGIEQMGAGKKTTVPAAPESMDLDKPKAPEAQVGSVTGAPVKLGPPPADDDSSSGDDAGEKASDKKRKTPSDENGPPEEGLEDDGNASEGEIDEEALKPLLNGEKIVKNLPNELRPYNESLYPRYTAGIYGAYRASNKPLPHEVITEDHKLSAEGSKPVAIAFREHSGVLKGFSGSLGPIKPTELGAKRPKMSYIMHSGCPAFKLEVWRGGKENKKVDIIFHANCFVRFRNEPKVTVQLSSATTAEREVRDRCNDLPLDLTFGQDGCLWETSMSLWPLGCDEKSSPFGAPAQRPRFQGITDEELWGLHEASRGLKWMDERLSPGDWTLMALYTFENIYLYKPWRNSEEALAKLSNFNGWWMKAMHDSVINGNLPHYRRQAQMLDQDINDPLLPLRDFQVSRDMVKTWRVKYENGAPISAEPESWQSYPAIGTFPDAESKALAHRVSVDRGRERENLALTEQLDKSAGLLKAEFRQCPTNPRLFWMEVLVDRSEAGVFGKTGGVVTLELDTRIKVIIHTEGTYEQAEFTGQVKPDILGRNSAQICAMVKVKGNIVPAEGNYSIAIELVTDGTSADRQIAALCEVGKGVERTKGVDIPALVLDSKPTIKETASLAAEVSEQSEDVRNQIEDRVAGVIENFNLNGDQVSALHHSFNSDTGALAIWGPPGTGKTWLLVAIAICHIKVGRFLGLERRPILLTASSNAAVDNALKKIVENTSKADRIRLCRFTNARSSSGPTKQSSNAFKAQADHRRGDAHSGKDTGDQASDEDDAWDFLEQYAGAEDATLGKYHHPRARAAFIRECFKDRTHPLNDRATGWQDAKRALDDPAKSGEERQNIKKAMRDSLPFWDEHFFAETDIVCATNNSASHETLTDHYKPKLAIVDEAASSPLPDVATPLAAFKEHLELVVLAGDHRQQGPVLSKGRNEFLHEARTSLFERIISDRDFPGDKVMLKTQHRMKGAHSAMISEVFYDGQLEDHPTLKVQTPLEKTIAQGLQSLKPHWNSRLRLAVDVSGHDAYEVSPDNSKSFVNEAEAQLLADHIEWLLWLPVAPGGRAVEAKDIVVISPYNGQVSRVRQVIGQRKIIARWAHKGKKPEQGADETKNIQRIDVMSSAMVQGSQREIVLLSWVANNRQRPTAIKFTRDPKQICVNFSRVISYQATFANWKVWMQAEMEHHGFLKTTTGKHGAFTSVVRHHRQMRDGVSRKHLEQLHAGEEPDAAEDILLQLAPRKAPAPLPFASNLAPRSSTTVFTDMRQHAQEQQRETKKQRRAGTAHKARMRKDEDDDTQMG